VPWSQFWERNYFADLMPAIQVVTLNYYFRGAVSGLGLVNLWIALTDLAAVVQQRGEADPVASTGSEA
jgi:hypothetical protein